MNKELLMRELSLVILITGAREADEAKAVKVMQSQHIPIQHVCRGEGTASNELLDYLGIGTTEKAVMFSVVPKCKVSRLFTMLDEVLSLYRLGKGIVFSVPVSGANLLLMKMLHADVDEFIQAQSEREKERMGNQSNHSLVMVTINQGYSEDVMAAAKGAGATGGTVLHARCLASDEPKKRWGITIQEEKEIVFILTKKEDKVAIMKAISETCGMHSEARGMVSSLPVEAVAGLQDSYTMPEF